MGVELSRVLLGLEFSARVRLCSHCPRDNVLVVRLVSYCFVADTPHGKSPWTKILFVYHLKKIPWPNCKDKKMPYGCE